MACFGAAPGFRQPAVEIIVIGLVVERHTVERPDHRVLRRGPQGFQDPSCRDEIALWQLVEKVV